MERILIIKNFLELVALTKNEKLRLIKELMSEWHLNETDVTASSAPAENCLAENTGNTSSEQNNETETASSEKTSSEAASQASEPPVTKRKGRKKKTEEKTASKDDTSPVLAPPVAKRRGRPKKEKPENMPQEKVSSTPAPPAETPKKRGRPKKVRTDGNTAEDTDKEPEMSSGTLSKQDAALIEKVTASKNIRDLLDDEPEIPLKTSKKRNPAFLYLADLPALKQFIVGQEYSFEFLYQWKEHKLLSPHVLTDLSPVGIYVPYKNLVFGKYRGFIISIYDEHVAENVSDAQETAQAMPAIDDEFWTIMDSLQWGVLKNYVETINRMLSKVGGDSLKKQYRTCSPKSNHVCGIGGFRYTINVK